jgi:hypothetical protein
MNKDSHRLCFKHLLHFFSLSLILLSISIAHAGMSDYQKKKIEDAINHSKLNVENTFDGKNFAADISKNKANRILSDYVKMLNRAVSTWNGMTSSAKTSPEGSQYFKLLQTKQAIGDQMRSAYKNIATGSTVTATVKQSAPTKQTTTRHLTAYQKEQRAREEANQAAKREVDARLKRQMLAERQQAAIKNDQKAKAKATKAVHNAECRSFAKAGIKPEYRELMTVLMQEYTGTKTGLHSVENVTKLQKIAQAVTQACDQSDYALLTSQRCYYSDDPALWCAAARKSNTLIPAMALHGAKEMAYSAGSFNIATPEEFMKRDGYLEYVGVISFNKRLTFSDEKFSAQRERIAKVLAAAGVSDTSQVWAEEKKKLDQLKAVVEKTASQWKNPHNAGSDYSSDVASKQIKRMHPNAKIHSVWLSRDSWKIHRNVFGVPLRRTKPGYIQFKLSDEKYCQLRPYTLTEQNIGSSDYQKAKGVKFGFVRFQVCQD